MPTGVYPRSEAHRERTRKAWLGNTLASRKKDESELKARATHPAYKTPEFRSKMASIVTGKKFSEETRAKIAERLKGNKNGSGKLPRSEASRDKMRQARTGWVVPMKDSGPEIAVQEFLAGHGVQFLKHQTIPEITHPKVRLHQFDIVIPADMIAIEVDGCYWHACPQCRAKQSKPRNYTPIAERDAQIVQEAAFAGWRVIRIWEHDVNAKNFDALTALIQSGDVKYG